MKVAVGAATKVGGRKENQDAFYFDEKRGLYLIGDGVGGTKNGARASRTVMDLAQTFVATGDDYLSAFFTHAHNTVCVENAQKQETASSTIVGLHLQDHTASWNHLGDSRLYVLSGNTFFQATQDHSLHNHFRTFEDCSAQALAYAKKRNSVTKTIGRPLYENKQLSGYVSLLELEATQQASLYNGDIFLLCTDGVHGTLPDSFLEDTLRRYRFSNDIQGCAQELVDLSSDVGDNATAVVVKVVQLPRVTNTQRRYSSVQIASVQQNI